MTANEGWPIQPNDAVYSDRLLIFADILGWTRAILASAADEREVPDLAVIAAALESYVVDSNFEGHSDVKATLMSDTIVASLRPSEHDRDSWTFWYLNKLVRLIRILWMYGYYVRGAITHGKIFHDGQCIFGPALVEAYNVEKHIAVFPRVIITESARPIIEGARFSTYPSFCKTDADGLCFLDWLVWYGDDLDDMQESLRTKIASESDPRIAAKHEWMLRYVASLAAAKSQSPRYE